MRLGTILRWAVGVGFVLFVAGALLGGFFTFDTHLYYGPPLLLTVFCVLALLCTATLERGRFVRLMWSGNAACAVCLVGWSLRLLMEQSIGRSTGLAWSRVMLAPTSWAALCAVIGLLTRERMTNVAGLWVRAITIACASVLALAVPVAILSADALARGDHRILVRLVGCLAVITGFGTIFTLIAARLRQLEGESEDVNEIRLEFTIVCPRCAQSQPMLTGGAACRHCGLRVKVLVP